jgi:hypothetical protein
MTPVTIGKPGFAGLSDAIRELLASPSHEDIITNAKVLAQRISVADARTHFGPDAINVLKMVTALIIERERWATVVVDLEQTLGITPLGGTLLDRLSAIQDTLRAVPNMSTPQTQPLTARRKLIWTFAP